MFDFTDVNNNNNNNITGYINQKIRYCQTSVEVLRFEVDFVLPLSQVQEQEEEQQQQETSPKSKRESFRATLVEPTFPYTFQNNTKIDGL